MHRRRPGQGGEGVFLGTHPAHELPDEEAIRARWGGGVFVLKARNEAGDKITTRRELEIEGPPKLTADAGAAPAPWGAPAAAANSNAHLWAVAIPALATVATGLFGYMASQSQAQQQFIAAMIQGNKADAQAFLQAMMANRPPSMGPQELVAMVGALKGQAGGASDFMEAVKLGLTLKGQAENGEDLSSLMQTVGSFMGGFNQARDMMQAGAMPPAPQVIVQQVPAPPGAPAMPAAPPTQEAA